VGGARVKRVGCGNVQGAVDVVVVLSKTKRGVRFGGFLFIIVDFGCLFAYFSVSLI